MQDTTALPQSQKYRMQNTKYKMQDTSWARKYKIQNAKYKIQNAGHHRPPSVPKPKIQNAK